jgi:hypothetical protein
LSELVADDRGQRPLVPVVATDQFLDAGARGEAGSGGLLVDEVALGGEAAERGLGYG